MRHNPYYSFSIIILFLFSHYQPLYWQLNIYQATSLQSQYTFTQLLSKVFLNKYNKIFSCNLTWSIMTKCILKKNWTCSADALQLTLASCYIRHFFYINSTLLLKTHFKPPSSVCNNFLLRSHEDFGRLLLLKYAIYSLFIALQISISDVHIQYYENRIQTIYYHILPFRAVMTVRSWGQTLSND